MFKFPIFDAHCHITQTDQPETSLRNCIDEGVERLAIGGTHPDDWNKQFLLKKSFPNHIYTSVGFHPWYLSEHFQNSLQTTKSLNMLRQGLEKADACGELGLDYALADTPEKRELQLDVFRNQLKIAEDLKKPLVLHCVKAHEPLLKVMENFSSGVFKGLVHSFIGPEQIMRRYIELGFKLGIGHRSLASKKTREALKHLGTNHWVLESDAPIQSREKRMDIVSVLEDNLKEISALLDLDQQSAALKSNERIRELFESSRLH